MTESQYTRKTTQNIGLKYFKTTRSERLSTSGEGYNTPRKRRICQAVESGDDIWTIQTYFRPSCKYDGMLPKMSQKRDNQDQFDNKNPDQDL
jgi:hypothetical protein